MRVLVALTLSVAFAGPLLAAEDPGLPPPSASGRERLSSLVPKAPAVELDGLFSRLAGARNRAEAAAIEAEITRRWAASGSATADLMLAWTAKAAAGGDAAKALDILDELTVREPGFAEAYYRRATLHLLAGRLSPALGDLRTVLRLEPRHFRAIRELAGLFVELDQPERALTLLRQLQVIDRHFDGLDEAIEEIVGNSHGRDI